MNEDGSTRGLSRHGASPLSVLPASPGRGDQQPTSRRAAVTDEECLDQYDLAMLAGGSDAVVGVALVALDHAGAIECGEQLVHELVAAGSFTLEGMRETKPNIFPSVFDVGFVVRSLQPLSPAAHPVEKAVFDVVVATDAVTGNLTAIRGAAAESSGVAIIREPLVELGLLRSEARRAVRARRLALGAATAGVTVALLVLAIGVSTGNWLPTIAAPLIFVYVGVFAGSRAEAERLGRTRGGSRALSRAQRNHPRPKLGSDPDPGRGPHLCLLLALHGPGLLWDVDPALALALDVPHLSDMGGCGGCGGCGGGCGC